MAYKDLREFIAKLEQSGQLHRVKIEVDPELEITEITDRVTKAGGPALLFEKVKGSNIPLLINAMGSYERMSMALGGRSLDEIAHEIEELTRPKPPKSFMDKLKFIPTLMKLSNFPPKMVSHAHCQEVVITDNPSLYKFPIIKCWPKDGGRFITLPAVFTKNPKTGTRNAGMYRLQVYDERTTGMHWHMHHDGARHYRMYREEGKRTEVAAALGGDPAITYAATAPMPPDIDEMMLAGLLRNHPVEMVKCKTIDMEVPADAEIVLEGYVEPAETRLEGPFGDHTGYYSLADQFPVFHITCITHRRNPIYPTTIVGQPPQEDYFMGKATERIFLPLLKLTIPEIVDFNMPMFGVFHNCVFVSIDKQYPFHAKKVMSSIWGMGQMMFSKIIVVVDKDVNVQNQDEVLWRMSNNIDPRRDIVFVDGPLDELDHACPIPKAGSKMGIDATRKWPSEGFTRDWPEDIVMTPEIKALVDKRWKEYGINL
ncbi:MAG: menaquinone biosynthesis decarboxylase [Planctomycetes bacterium RIFCSPHIGHO2_02_FULL_50_42]|nr:MAG: menaquinone biosynthesis decarboxylase [Planctomycetes bacterium GWA2_50_13]OHB88171.1 MAG: menaquinone biosynthesis decarboxylase [Planctomycetes bacterium RIFCSPHIGHO2_02_FULL_50_42]OHB91697.1 MAG: menaquinone biosynthesis decarboxylase [Planctomycetes bacterium RIFCSPHIGHO2_12_FULL_51_37]OHB95727.1 MAG: menaquinone biosynthesis decarboxylase [Planctomycetes bacterium RIFCSPLOWO2_02_FULL_50_16]OHC02948.1 MAG: menaquinone biosynthesis decarboxylase [Planctomycetes bacterium RIFCSPLOWO2